MNMVNLQWSAITGMLISELLLVVMLLLPFISAKFWHHVYYSKPVQQILHWKYFKAGTHIVGALLVLFLLDAVRAMYSYAQTKDVQSSVPTMSTADKDALINMRVYRAERNFFIVFFTLFFGVLLRRLIKLILIEAELMAETEGTVLTKETVITEERAPGQALEKLTKVQ